MLHLVLFDVIRILFVIRIKLFKAHLTQTSSLSSSQELSDAKG